ncbi:hypothetical protein E2C01_058859 [Portunus trituberculatus]|uniref:Uncharacterized protein n=1 Tax=Portunus trituberculatus TaxID=210409 RepID=A0A5B7H4D1_PORTR|nr:hypothetical protein [Portunus trituberculatus]
MHRTRQAGREDVASQFSGLRLLVAAPFVTYKHTRLHNHHSCILALQLLPLITTTTQPVSTTYIVTQRLHHTTTPQYYHHHYLHRS